MNTSSSHTRRALLKAGTFIVGATAVPAVALAAREAEPGSAQTRAVAALMETMTPDQRRELTRRCWSMVAARETPWRLPCANTRPGLHHTPNS